MNDKIFIPKLCKVGFNPRTDTYTGMLGYVIYNDGKTWRKEQSWESWRYKYETPEEFERKKLESYNSQINGLFERSQRNDHRIERHWNGKDYVTIENITSKEDIMKKLTYENFRYNSVNTSADEKIKPFEFENEPLEGFVLNKKAGGDRYGWNPRQTYCRVYDPRGFEFEITIPNLLYILENTNSIKGKGLDGKFIYGWQGKDLVLVPENAPEFEAMLNYTKIQDGKVLKKDMVVGGIYCNKDNDKLVYMGDFYEVGYYNWPSSKKKLWFYHEKYDNFIKYAAAQSIKVDTGETTSDFANIMDKLEKNKNFYAGELEYEKVENPEERLTAMLSKNSYGHVALFVKRNNKFFTFNIYIRRHSYNYNTYYNVSVLQEEETFNSIKQITNKYELWQLKMTN